MTKLLNCWQFIIRYLIAHKREVWATLARTFGTNFLFRLCHDELLGAPRALTPPPHSALITYRHYEHAPRLTPRQTLGKRPAMAALPLLPRYSYRYTPVLPHEPAWPVGCCCHRRRCDRFALQCWQQCVSIACACCKQMLCQRSLNRVHFHRLSTHSCVIRRPRP